MGYDLIVTVAELNRRVANITCLSIPKAVKETELKEIVKRQVMIRKYVYKQKGIAIPFTLKGKPKPVDQLLAELKQVILCQHIRIRKRTTNDSARRQQLHTLFERPSLLVGVKIKHRFEEDGCFTWYEEIITHYKKQNFLYTSMLQENIVCSPSVI